MTDNEPVNGEDFLPESIAEHPVAARLLRVGRRLRTWDITHPWILDTAVVLAIFLMFCAYDLINGNDTSDEPFDVTQLAAPQMLLAQAALVVPLWWRRRSPSLVVHAVAVVFALQWSIGIILRADVALLVAVYSLVRHGRPPRLIWAAPVLLAACLVVLIRLAAFVSVWDVTFLLATAGAGAAALGFARRVRGAQLAALRERAVRLETERDQRVRLAAATERARVAREMHDIIGHSLSVIITLADGGAYSVDTAPDRSKQALNLISDTGRRSLTELRRMLGVLRDHSDEPDLHPQPGIADLEGLCSHIRTAGPRVEYSSTGDLDALDRGVQLAAYRIVQEALTNTLKHAGSHTTVRLALRIEDSQLRILVIDTGSPGRTGTPARPDGQGHGLIGMRERATLYGGTVTAGPVSGGGWRVWASLDLSPIPTPHLKSDPA
jgi:signal transduction histidine kinase